MELKERKRDYNRNTTLKRRETEIARNIMSERERDTKAEIKIERHENIE